MKLVRYLRKRRAHENKECYGLLTADKVVCIHSLAKMLNVEFPPLFEDFVTLGTSAVKKAEQLLETASEKDVANASSPADQATLLAPIAFPPIIICMGLELPRSRIRNRCNNP